MKFYHIDTFSGIGGFALAAHWISTNEVPWETVCFVEIDKFCKQILAKHWPDVPCIDDINDVASIVKVVGEYNGKEISANLAKGGDANESHGRRFILTGGFP